MNDMLNCRAVRVGLIVVFALAASCSSCHDELLQDPDSALTLDASPDAPTDASDVRGDDLGGDLGDDLGDDLGFDADASAPIEPFLGLTPLQDGVSVDGAPDVEQTLGAGQARLGRIVAEQTGYEGIWSHCRTGDFRLYNALIDVCIQQESTNRYETFTGGKLVDARRHGQTGEDVLDMIMPLIDIRTAAALRVYTVRDGSDGGAAVLRVEGYDIDLAHLVGVLGRTFAGPVPMEVVTEYRLAADSDAVEIVTWYRNVSPTLVRSGFVGDWFAWGERARLWSDSHGFGTTSRAVRWVAGLGGDRSYGLVFEGEGATTMGIASSQGIPWAEMRAMQLRLEPGEQAMLRRWFIVGDGTLDSVRKSALALRGEVDETTARTITVRDTAGAPVRGVGVAVHGNDQGLNYGVTDADGQVELWLPPAQSFNATLDGLPANQRLDVSLQFDAEGQAQLELAQAGRLKLSVTELGTGAPLTARAELRAATSFALFVLKGTLETALAAGNYKLVVTRGLEYDVEIVDITIVAGEELALAVALNRGVDTVGWIAADFHQHMEASIDSDANVYDRVLDNASQGVELVVPTDHEVITDLRPIVASLGLGDTLTTFPGVEISPVQTHINIYPMPYQPHLRGRGSIELARLVDGVQVNRRIPEILALARELEHRPIVQLNHARNGSGMFNTTRFNPENDALSFTHRDFSLNFDAMEIINRFSDTCQLMRDWSGLLNVGHIVAGLGNSDSHAINARSGVPRNYLRMDDSAPGQISEQAMRDTLLDGRLTVGSLSFIDFGDAMLPGDLLTAEANTPVSFHVRVQTPNWSRATHLFVIVNGSIVRTLEREAEADPRFDFDAHIELELSEDSWVIFFAYGPEPSGDVPYNVPVLAFTNPVFVDVDGDADSDGNPWEPPGARPIELSALDQGYCRD
ncbi:MAG: CehA/McbA family metallohydrolase [Bradymonadaceae bacterium]|nr:CehA/McbA family metallohydrolase [Lujinxingiaceae bacterium]